MSDAGQRRSRSRARDPSPLAAFRLRNGQAKVSAVSVSCVTLCAALTTHLPRAFEEKAHVWGGQRARVWRFESPGRCSVYAFTPFGDVGEKRYADACTRFSAGYGLQHRGWRHCRRTLLMGRIPCGLRFGGLIFGGLIPSATDLYACQLDGQVR